MIIFRPLKEIDLPLLHCWLNQEHMRIFYQKKSISLDEVIKKYVPRIKKNTLIHCHIAYNDNQPIGAIQSYRICDYPKYAKEINMMNGISIDLFIGESKFLGKGLGRQMLQLYLSNIAFKIFESEKVCYICHEEENLAAIACSESAGFIFVKKVIEKGKPSKLLRYAKDTARS